MLAPLVEQVRKRKGLPLEPPKASEFMDNAQRLAFDTLPAFDYPDGTSSC
jgi:hypothetical protein